MAGTYHQHHPERTVFYRVLFHYFERFLAEYDDRFEKEYGYFRPVIKDVVEKYLDCGNPMCEFARINFHPHIHVLMSEGGTALDGTFHRISNFNDEAIRELFTHEVFSLLSLL